MSTRANQPRSRARRRALQALYQWQITGQEAAVITRQFLEVQDMSGVDEAFFLQLVEGVAREHEKLDESLGPFLDRSLDQVDLMERVVVRMGAFELIHCPEQPLRVVINECVDLAHRFGSEQGHSFVNAVLDSAGKELRPLEATGKL